MTLTDIIALSKAGFTAEQISKLSGLETAQNTQQTTPPAPAPQQTTPPAPAPQQTTPPAQNAGNTGDWMSELVNRIQKANVGASNNTVQQTETADQILANIINPKEEK